MMKPLPEIGFKFKGPKQDDDMIDILDRELKAKMDVEEVEDVHHALDLKAQEWEDEGIGLPGVFRLSMRKGQFCMDKTGKAFNACMASASGHEAEAFCAQYNLPLAKRS